MRCAFVALLLAIAAVVPVRAGVLEDDRADLMYHYYDGGGVTIDGRDAERLVALGVAPSAVVVTGDTRHDAAAARAVAKMAAK